VPAPVTDDRSADRAFETGSAPHRPPPERTTSVLLWIAAAIAGIECLALGLYGFVLWRHFDVGVDDAIPAQGTWLIAHGVLSPFSTIYTDPFWKNTFALIWWPLALPRLLFPSGYTLLAEQALAIGATTFLLLRFAVVRSSQLSRLPRSLLFVAVGLLSLLNPWALNGFSFAAHPELFGALGLVLALSGALEHRRGMLGLGAVIAVLSSSAVILTTLAVGIGLALSARTRRAGVAVALLALGFLLSDLALGAHQGFSVSAQYGYLVGGHPAHLSEASVAVAVLTHPLRALRVLARRGHSILELVAFGGIIGLASPPALLPVLLDVPINGLTVAGNFIALTEGFQNWPEVALLLLGSIDVSVALLGRGRLLRHLSGLVGVPLALALTVAAVHSDLGLRRSWLTQPAPSFEALGQARALLRPGAEVVGTIDVVGRLARRRNLYILFSPTQLLPVCRPEIDFVIETAGPYAVLDHRQLVGVARALAAEPGAEVLLHRSHVWTIALGHLEAGRSTLRLPRTFASGPTDRAFDIRSCR